MGCHPVTADDVLKKAVNMAQRKNDMRKANFKMPYIQNMNTEVSTYKNAISDAVQPHSLNPGRPRIMDELKAANLKVGAPSHDYSTEFADQFVTYKRESQAKSAQGFKGPGGFHLGKKS